MTLKTAGDWTNFQGGANNFYKKNNFDNLCALKIRFFGQEIQGMFVF